ncbi:MAG: trypsin-like peptidase domain-containing protein [Planctomycetota bacterium]
MILPLLALSMLAAPVLQQDQDGELAKVLEMQRRRTAIIAKVEPAVCSVMALNAPGGGSGVIFDPRGYVLSNFHVTSNNKVMKIGLPDGRLYMADVIGIDPGGDIAVLALRGEGPLPDGSWPNCELGDSDKLQVGGFCYAMGNPFLLASDFKPTVTMGVVSGINRYQKGTGPNQRMLVYPDCVQVDAPVNPGNSGGPLFDENGLLVGINGRITIRDRGRVNTGVGFAVSVNQIRNFLPDLLAGRHAEHGTLDLNVWTFAKDQNTGERGRFHHVQALFEDSVAAKAGVEAGARVLSFDGEKLNFANDLARKMTMLPAGFEVELEFQNFNGQTGRYDEPVTKTIVLYPMDTGSVKDPRPNVPAFDERPDFDALAKEMERRQAEAKVGEWWGELDEKQQREWRYRFRRLDPDRFKAPKQPEKKDEGKKDDEEKDGEEEGGKQEEQQEPEKVPDAPAPDSWKEWKDEFRWKFDDPGDLFRRFPLPGLEPKEKIDSGIVDVERLRSVWSYMDGLVTDVRARFDHRLAGRTKGEAVEQEVVVTPWVNGRPRKPRARTIVARGQDYEVREDGAETLRNGTGDTNVDTGVVRWFEGDPFLRPWAVHEALADAWLEGGIHVGNRVGQVVAFRGPGKRAVYLERGSCLPLGYRYRDPRRGGLVDVRFLGFANEDGKDRPTKARVYLSGDLVEELAFTRGGPGLVPAERVLHPVPSDDIAKRLAPVFRSVVKIHGASGLRGVDSYQTGIVISEKGHILTWDHVLLQAATVQVVLEDGSVQTARVVRKWDDLGVAVLRIDTVDDDGKPLPLTPIDWPMEPRELENGTVVYAVSNAFRIAEYDEKLSVVIGVVTGKAHSDLRLDLRNFPYKGEVILIDAPTGPGSQGGGLFSIDGEILGLLCPIAESRETNSQLFMAIPAHVLAPIVAYHRGDRDRAAELNQALNESKKKAPVYTGIELFDTGRRRSPPAYVDRVRRGSPAAKAGLRSDDMIVRIDDYPIQSIIDFKRVLTLYGPGEKIDITVKRGSQVLKVSLRLEEAQ